MPYCPGPQAADAFLSIGLATQFILAAVAFLLIVTILSVFQKDGVDSPTPPTPLPESSLFAIYPFFRRRYDFLNWGFYGTGRGGFRFNLLWNTVVVASRESTRQAFFTAKGPEGLSGGIVHGVTSGLETRQIHKRRANAQRNGPLSELIPPNLEDSRRVMDSWRSDRTFDLLVKVDEAQWDQLEDALKDLNALGYHSSLGRAHQHRLFALLDTVLSTRKFYRRLLQYRDEQAQLLINALQWLLRIHPAMKDGQQKRKFLQALLRVSKRAKLLPKLLELGSVRIREVIIESPNVDIFQGVHDGREVCLKKYRVRRQPVREDLVELLIKEVVLWCNHPHPSILPFNGIYRLDGSNSFDKIFLVSPYYSNGTVVEYLIKNPNAERRLLLSDVLSGLSFLHENKIVHGDIKGANILVDSQGRACLADLGLSRLADAQILTWSSIQSLVPPWGSLFWLAPELLAQSNGYSAPSPPSTSSDIYAFGCLAYEIFTGLCPFQELSCRTSRRTYYQVHRLVCTEVVQCRRRPQKPAHNSPAFLRYGLTDSIWDVMENCWAHEPRCRPSVNDLSKLPDLVEVFDDRPHE